MADGTFDVIVFREVGYWLSRPDLDASVTRIVDGLAAGGDLVAVHWRPPGDAYELTGDDVHAALRSREELHLLASYVEDVFVLDAFRRKATPAW